MPADPEALAPVARIKTVGELLGLRFVIPAYQRGYRWTATEVTELLDDLEDYRETRRRDSPNYCLQPLVVKQRADGSYEVIDGQQRLTTIGLILHRIARLDPVDVVRSALLELPAALPSDFRGKERLLSLIDRISPPAAVHITYETRSTASGSELTALLSKPRPETLDEYYIRHAARTIDAWFARGGASRDPQRLLRTLTEHTEVIWYAAGEREDSIELFQRLNIGRIPLTNAELIRALLLGSRTDARAPESERVLIAEQWSAIERRLADDRFWYFLTNAEPEEYPTRIDLLFEVITGKKQSDRYAVYDDVEGRLRKALGTAAPQGKSAAPQKPLGAFWSETVMAPFQELLRFYRDAELYPLIGVLIAMKQDLSALRAIWKRSVSKSLFIRRLMQEQLLPLIGCPRESAASGAALAPQDIRALVEAVRYDTGPEAARCILLLHNALTAKRRGERFSFCDYKKNKWSLEHICPQNPPPTSSKKEPPKASPGGASAPAPEEDADHAARLHGIGNLALLERRDNSLLANAGFDVKRRQIIDLDRDGRFIPVCTRHVFLKYYSADAEPMNDWTLADAAAYTGDIVSTLTDFFTPASAPPRP